MREALALPDDWQPQGLITVGYPAEEKTKTRALLETRVWWMDVEQDSYPASYERDWSTG